MSFSVLMCLSPASVAWEIRLRMFSSSKSRIRPSPYDRIAFAVEKNSQSNQLSLPRLGGGGAYPLSSRHPGLDPGVHAFFPTNPLFIVKRHTTKTCTDQIHESNVSPTICSCSCDQIHAVERVSHDLLLFVRSDSRA